MTVHDLPGRHDHERGLELAATALDFELSRPEAAELEIHLTGCPTCARRAAAMRTDGMALGRPMSLLPSARVDTAIHAEIAGRRSRPQRLVLVAAAALFLLALLGATAVGAYLLRSWQTLPITVAPQPTDRVAIANPRPDASPIVAPGPSAAPIVAPIVPPLDPDFVAVGGASRGAYALRLQGDFGSEGFHGGGNCFWDQTGQPAVLDSFVVTELQAFGEQLTLSVNEPRAGTTSTSVGSLVFNRSIDGRQFGSYNSMDRAYVRFDSTGGDLRVLSFRDLAQNLADEPEEEAPFAEFHRPLGGFQGDDRLSGVVAWRCEPAVPQPTPFANPTPKCPSPEQAPEPPRRLGVRGGWTQDRRHGRFAFDDHMLDRGHLGRGAAATGRAAPRATGRDPQVHRSHRLAIRPLGGFRRASHRRGNQLLVADRRARQAAHPRAAGPAPRGRLDRQPVGRARRPR